MTSLNKDNSTVMSVRVPNEVREEFIALTQAVGMQTSRKLREIFDNAMVKMRCEINEKRQVHGGETWEDEWTRLQGDNNAQP